MHYSLANSHQECLNHVGGLARLQRTAGGEPEGAGDDVSGQPQRLVGSAVDVLHEHVHASMVASVGQVEELIEGHLPCGWEEVRREGRD